MENFKTPDDLIEYLENTLIPDLEESGSEGHVADYQDCISAIQDLQIALEAANLPGEPNGENGEQLDLGQLIVFIQEDARARRRQLRQPDNNDGAPRDEFEIRTRGHAQLRVDHDCYILGRITAHKAGIRHINGG